MEQLISWVTEIEDKRQQSKVRYKLCDIVAIVLLATLANADEWEEIADFAEANEETLRKYLELESGIPSHDTIRRVMGMIAPDELQKVYGLWQERLNSGEGENLKKLICIDGKTMRSNKSQEQKANHIVSAWCNEDKVCLGQKVIDEKSNEITAIPQLLDSIQIKGQIVTIDAMGTQREIASKIKSKKADYMLALKGNQSSLHSDIQLYFSDDSVLDGIKGSDRYLSTTEKSHGQVEKREYFQTDDINWLTQKSAWQGLKSIVMERTTISKGDDTAVEHRYFISSLKPDIKLASKAIRGHWSVESMHWQLDVTFREDANSTIDKTAAQNQNIIRKWSLSILSLMNMNGKNVSMKRKRYIISLNPVAWLDKIFEI